MQANQTAPTTRSAAPQAAPKAPRDNALAAVRRHLSTEEVAARLLVRPQTVRRSLCINGEYMGLRPVKLANRRLLWNAAAVDALVMGEAGK